MIIRFNVFLKTHLDNAMYSFVILYDSQCIFPTFFPIFLNIKVFLTFNNQINDSLF